MCAAAAVSEAPSSSAPEEEEQIGFKSERTGRLSRAFPLVKVVDLEFIKQALVLGAVDTGAPTETLNLVANPRSNPSSHPLRGPCPRVSTHLPLPLLNGKGVTFPV